MIIKSLSRKTLSFGQLLAYMTKTQTVDSRYYVYHNVFGRKVADLEQEFVNNAQYLAQRKNGNQLYHDILSIRRASQLSETRQKELLQQIAYHYVNQRAAQNLVFGVLHDDHKEHLHYHLLISANVAGDSQRTRLSKAEFDQIKQGLEQRVLKHYPELQQTHTMSCRASEKLSHKGAELKRRTGKTPQRDIVKTKLETIFRTSQTKAEFFAALQQSGLAFYARGNTLGVKDLVQGRKHRLKTLGVLDSFHALSDRITLDQKATQQTEKEYQTKQNDKEDIKHREYTEDNAKNSEHTQIHLEKNKNPRPFEEKKYQKESTKKHQSFDSSSYRYQENTSSNYSEKYAKAKEDMENFRSSYNKDDSYEKNKK